MSNSNVDFNFQYDESQNFNVYPCTEQQAVYLNDINAANYSNGYINFNGSNLVGSDNGKQFIFSEAVIHIPYKVTLNAVGGTFNSNENSFAVGLKGSHHLIDSATLKFDGVSITQNTQFNNFYMNEKMKEMSIQEHRLYGDLMGHEWDNPDSYTYDTTVGGLPIETNNDIKPPLEGAFLNQGNVPKAFCNDGHLKRMLKTNTNITLADSTYTKLIGTALVPNHGQSCLLSATTTELVFENIAYIPLSQLSDFFSKMPSTSASTGFELRLQTNIASSNSYSATYKSTLAALSKQEGDNIYYISAFSSVQSIGKTCPFMLSQAGNKSGTGLSLALGGTTGVNDSATVTMNISIGNSTQKGCRIMIPVVSYTPEYMTQILQNPTSRILYNDYYIDQIQNVRGGESVTRVLSSQVSRPRRTWVIPFLSTTPIGGAILVPPYAQMFSSAPNTSSMCRLNNFQIQIGGTNLFSEQMKYNFDFYNNNYLQLASKINGNSMKSLFHSGCITKTMWEKCYGSYLFNIERCDSEITDNQKKNVTISFKCDALNTIYYDFLVITEFQCETYLNRALGKITASAN